MGWFSDFVHDPIGTVSNTVKEVVTDPGKVLNDIGNTIDQSIIQPIKNDPVTFIAAAVAYAYGIPGLEFAGAGTGVAVGTATTASRLAQGDSFNDALKKGVISGAVTGAMNYGSEYYKTNWGNPVDLNAPVGPDRFGSSTNTAAQNGVVAENALTPSSTASLEPAALDLSNTGNLPPTDAQVAFDNSSVYRNYNANAPKSGLQNLELQSLDIKPTPNVNYQEALNGPASAANPPAPVYQSSVPTPNQIAESRLAMGDNYSFADKNFVNDYQNSFDPSDWTTTRTDTRWEVDPNNPNRSIKIEGTPGPAPVVEMSTVAGPNNTPLTLSGVADTALAAGQNAYSFAAEHPYYTLGGAALLSSAGRDDKKNDQPTSTPDQQVGDPRFYMSLPQLQMKRDYQQYEGDYGTYGQTGGTHKFFTDPIYEPANYGAKEGGYVKMEEGGYLGGLSPQLGAPMPQPYQQQPMQQGQQQPMQQPMQQGALGALAGIPPKGGAPMQKPTGGLPKVAPQQQNPNYRYFNYGTVPSSVQPNSPQGPMSPNYATGGLAMAHGGNVPDGRTDNIHAMLSPGEYVMDAETVALLGNGNNDAGAKRLDYMREAVRKQKGGALAKGKISPDAQSPLAYLSGRMA